MKHIKKFFKKVFGNTEEGIDYIRKVLNNNSAPVLIVDGPACVEFADWIGQAQGSPSYATLGELIDGKVSSGPGLTIIKDAHDFPDPAIQAALEAHRSGHNIVLPMISRPRSIAYIKDPSLLSLTTEEWMGDMIDEIEELKQKIS